MRKSLEQRDCCQVVRGVVIMKNKWIHFSIDRESLIGMLSGVGIVILSVIMTIFNNDIANIILREILMILVLGFFFPLYFTIIENKKSV